MERRDSGPTPEKQLLKLIEQPGTADQQKETLKRRSIALFSPSVLRGKLSFFKEKAAKYLAGKKKASLGVKEMNRVLAFCTLVMAAYLAVDVIGAIGDLNKTSALEITPWEAKDTHPASSAGKLDYVEKTGIRQVFQFKSHEKVDDSTTGVIRTRKTDREIMREFLDDMKLIAVSMDPEQPLALIKDKEGNSRFWKEGAMISGVIKIIKIFESNVLMGYKKEEEFLRR